MAAGYAVGQTHSDRNSVELSASVQSNPPRITLQWESFPNTTGFTVYRKLKSATSWGSILATPAASSTQYQDNSVAVGQYYEYKVVRNATLGTGYGYIATGIEVPPVEYRGKLILLVDNTLASQLTAELATLQSDLKADGWTVLRRDVSRTAPVTTIKGIIQTDYNADPANVKAVYLVGHVPVPYSGNVFPDGHTDHAGAWPADTYYADVNGNWTDNSLTALGGSRPQNHNVPGDGKFDQSDIPSAAELQVGRVDLSDLPAFSQSEVQLVRNYLNKSHQFKTKQFSPLVRGIIFDNLNWAGYPLAASGYRSIMPCVGPSNTQVLNTIGVPNVWGDPLSTYINNQSYTWAFGCGGGSFIASDQVATTQQLASSVTNNAVFNMLFGSYFGDWDSQDNLLRAFIARGQALTSVWSAIPNWWFHHMAMGDNIGYGAQVSMSNTTLYAPMHNGWQGSVGKVHLGLMGDPSLRMTMVSPPSNLQVSNNNGAAQFTWNASSETVLGYYIYHINAQSGAVTRVVPSLVTGTSYSSPSVPFVAGQEYMVRAVKLHTSASGSYYNLSLGALGTSSGTAVPDCLGVPGGGALPGTACNDGNANTGNDTWTASCACVGQVLDCDGIPGGSAVPGSGCNDGNPNTGNDAWTANCTCVGQVIDCNGVPGGAALPGSGCNDGNPNTGNDAWTVNCTCVGQVIDCNGVPGGAALPGTACNDGDPNTGNDTWTANCSCVGQVVDCAGVAGGTAFVDNCGTCVGGTTGLSACVQDCSGTWGGAALPGTACNDGDPNTGNDTWTANCTCVGQVLDCAGVAGGTAFVDNCATCVGGTTGLSACVQD
ncbi:MAG: fibronectin type III domain-containing protein, partial [Flavobacteriales bacterium]|nr:fibronectin type III domain-containing protein [Flavobacteriales bacterium]